jgi:hypothetical protein
MATPTKDYHFYKATPTNDHPFYKATLTKDQPSYKATPTQRPHLLSGQISDIVKYYYIISLKRDHPFLQSNFFIAEGD